MSRLVDLTLPTGAENAVILSCRRYACKTQAEVLIGAERVNPAMPFHALAAAFNRLRRSKLKPVRFLIQGPRWVVSEEALLLYLERRGKRAEGGWAKEGDGDEPWPPRPKKLAGLATGRQER